MVLRDSPRTPSEVEFPPRSAAKANSNALIMEVRGHDDNRLLGPFSFDRASPEADQLKLLPSSF